MGVVKGMLHVVYVCQLITTRPQNGCSKFGGTIAPRYLNDLDVVAELILAENIEPTHSCVVKSKTVRPPDHVKQATVERYARSNPHTPQDHLRGVATWLKDCITDTTYCGRLAVRSIRAEPSSGCSPSAWPVPLSAVRLEKDFRRFLPGL